MKILIIFLWLGCLTAAPAAAQKAGGAADRLANRPFSREIAMQNRKGIGLMADPITDHLFSPEIVMQNRKEIGLTDEQQRAITTIISSLQSKVLELQWDVHDEQQKLVDLLGGIPVDEEAALRQAGRLMDIERRVKEAHLQALIRIKNQLTSTQQTRLRESLARQGNGG